MIAVFDVGNVLIRWAPEALALELAGDLRRVKKLRDDIFNAAFFHELDLSADSGPVVEKYVGLYPEFSRELKGFAERWMEAIPGPIEENVALVRELKSKGLKVFCITNYAGDKFEGSRLRFPFFDWFDELIVSGRENIAKPDPRIFHLLCERTGHAPRDLVFADDSEANVVAARAIGYDAIHYAPGVDLRQEFRARGLPL